MAPTSIVLNSRSSSVEILAYVTAMSASVTPSAVIEMVKSLDRTANTEKIGSTAVGAAMSIRTVIKNMAASSNIAFPAALLVNNELNFSAMALMGHMLFCLDDEALTPEMKAAKEKYVASIGGYTNLKVFGKDGVIEGKEARTMILRKWGAVLHNYDVTRSEEVFAAKFPHMVASRKWTYRNIPGFSIIEEGIATFIGAVSYLFSLVYYPMMPVLMPAYAIAYFAKKSRSIIASYAFILLASALTGNVYSANLESNIQESFGYLVPLSAGTLYDSFIVPYAPFLYNATTGYYTFLYNVILGAAGDAGKLEDAKATARGTVIAGAAVARTIKEDTGPMVKKLADGLSIIAAAMASGVANISAWAMDAYGASVFDTAAGIYDTGDEVIVAEPRADPSEEAIRREGETAAEKATNDVPSPAEGDEAKAAATEADRSGSNVM